MSRFEFDIFHRDFDYQGDEPIVSWFGDHAVTGPNDLCTGPTEFRTVTSGKAATGFNDEWIYRCVPDGDLDKAHVMTSVGHLGGYSIGSFTPGVVFNDITSVSWEVNQTDLGDRQWTEVKIIPAAAWDPQRLPCSRGLPCGTDPDNTLGDDDNNSFNFDEAGAVGTQWGGLRARQINDGINGEEYTQAFGSLGYRGCSTCPYARSKRFNDLDVLRSKAIRLHNEFRDNGDGTITWALTHADGEVDEFTVPGAFPEGPVRVVFADHNYTPLKSPASCSTFPELECDDGSRITADAHREAGLFTWHWDNIEVR